jgi:hypothetical protein
LSNTLDIVSQFIVPSPNGVFTETEKNWMPNDDMPFHFVKWSNPVEVVHADPVEKTCKTVFLGESSPGYDTDWRGSSQVITIGEYRAAIIHETHSLENETPQQFLRYRHRVLLWDKDWNLVQVSKTFSFLGVWVEFCCGWAIKGNDVYISCSTQDSAAYVIRIPQDKFWGAINV